MRVRHQILSLILALAVLCFGSGLSMWAQSTNTGTIVGTITDQSGAVVPNVAVTLTEAASGAARTTTTNDAGHYLFANVNPGHYSISLTKQGFATTKADTEVKVGLATTINLALQVGASSTTVEVQAAGTELQTMNATVGNTITSDALDALPSLGRDVSTFVTLQPGVSPDGSVAGAVVDQSYFSLDGGNNTNDMDGSMCVYTAILRRRPDRRHCQSEYCVSLPAATGVLPTPQDSVEEFKVNTAGQTADFNSSAGAEVKVVTKRGTERAGTARATNTTRTTTWAANTWDNNSMRTAVATSPAFTTAVSAGRSAVRSFPRMSWG